MSFALISSSTTPKRCGLPRPAHTRICPTATGLFQSFYPLAPLVVKALAISKCTASIGALKLVRTSNLPRRLPSLINAVSLFPVIHHATAPGAGKLYTKHYDVELTRHDPPRVPPPSPSPTIVQHHLVHSFCIQCPLHPVGPLEPFPVTYTVTCRPGVTPSKFITSVKRVVELYNENSVSPPSPLLGTFDHSRPSPGPPSPHQQLSPYDVPAYARSRNQVRDDDAQISLSDVDFEDEETADTMGADETDSAQSPSGSVNSSASKSSRSVLLQEASSFPRFPASTPQTTSVYRSGAIGDTYSQQVTMHIPAPKSKAHWAVGQTMRTGMVRVRFVISCKVRELPVRCCP